MGKEMKPKKPFRRNGKPAPQTKAKTISDVRPSEEVRLNRYLAQAGVASRRAADDIILDGRVRVNGAVVDALGTRIKPNDQVFVDGKLVSPGRLDYILLNKPGDTITTVSDERGRKTVLDLLELSEEERAGLYPVGRLDRHTQGLLLITNDGDLAHHLMHPKYGVTKVYRVVTDKVIPDEHLSLLLSGITLDDGIARADKVAAAEPYDGTSIAVSIHEGRNHIVRRMFAALGYEDIKLERVSYGPLNLKGVRRGKWRRLHPHEIAKLYRLVKLKPGRPSAPEKPLRSRK